MCGLGVNDVEVKSMLMLFWIIDLILLDVCECLCEYGIVLFVFVEGSLILLELEFIFCFCCGLFNVWMIVSFGLMLCKWLYVCDVCKELFEGFKSV